MTLPRDDSLRPCTLSPFPKARSDAELLPLARPKLYRVRLKSWTKEERRWEFVQFLQNTYILADFIENTNSEFKSYYPGKNTDKWGEKCIPEIHFEVFAIK